jgi:hypothetical protein
VDVRLCSLVAVKVNIAEPGERGDGCGTFDAQRYADMCKKKKDTMERCLNGKVKMKVNVNVNVRAVTSGSGCA